MIDELSIQQKRPSAAPYWGFGGIAGAGAGYLAATQIDAVKKYVSQITGNLERELQLQL